MPFSSKQTKTFSSCSPEETYELGKNLARSIPKGAVVTLKGDLGAGKTTFAKGFIAELASCSLEIIQSPTFVYLNIYETAQGSLCHFDLYRIKQLDAFEQMGFMDYLDGNHLCLIEWPEVIETILPKNKVQVLLGYASENMRLIEIHQDFS